MALIGGAVRVPCGREWRRAATMTAGGPTVQWFGIGALLVVVFTILTALVRANELFCVSSRRGKVLVVRGALPEAVHAALERELRLPAVDHALVKGFANDDEVRLTVTGLGDASEQRVHDLFALYPLELAAWPRSTSRTWWQVVGFVWLAWWMQERDAEPPQGGPPKSNVVPFRK